MTRLVLASAAALVLVAGCAARRHQPDATDLPDDFAMSITVLPAHGSGMEPAWYVLGPDNVLHAALGERLSTSTFPPAIRLLSREQVRHVWELVVNGGMTGEGTTPAQDAQAGAPAGTAIMYVAAMGRRRSFIVPEDRQAGLEPVVGELRRLGWVPETARPPDGSTPADPATAGTGAEP